MEIKIICEKSIRLFYNAEKYMKVIGIEIIDTMFEFGFTKTNEIEFMKDVFTPDNSHFIVNGVIMPNDILRQMANESEALYLSHPTNDINGSQEIVLPDHIYEKLNSMYKSFYHKLYSSTVISDVEYYNFHITRSMKDSFKILNKYVVILVDSKNYVVHVETIREELKKIDILAFVHYVSIHKGIDNILQYLEDYEDRKYAKIIYITVSGLSNNLNGFVSANVKRPVIACPSFSDKTDYQVNIHSTLQTPSDVPSACILKPDNAAAFCARLFSL